MSVLAERLETPASTRLREWPRSPIAVIVRALLQRALLFPILRRFCRPMRIERDPALRSDEGPFVFVANHASHADTALILRAMPPRLRRRLAPAAAEDYFFRSRARGAIASMLIGAFPFPRRGRTGLARAERLLDDGWSVLMFPEGTRSTDGRVGTFKPGVGVLSARGFPVVPIGIAGAREVMPKGRRLPRANPVSVLIGAPIQPDRSLPPAVAAERIRRRVSRLHAAARLLRPPKRRTLMQRARGLAHSRTGLTLVFTWGVAEALLFPIGPDIGVALLAVAAPSRFLPLALASTAGSVAGGAVSYPLGPTPAGALLLEHAPLVTDRMRGHALEALSSGGAGSLIGQPWTGIPFKVFGYQTAAAGVSFGSFLMNSIAGRGFRIILAGGVFAGAAWAPQRLVPGWVERLYALFVVAFLVLFGVGLAGVVSSWS
jgi:1-acyl-sn-glycerol-3-phosphate acyltransferase/membrane protein YqaA with SNARE-associated domain